MQTRQQRREIFLARSDAVKEDHVRAAFFQAILHRTGQPFAVLLLIVNDGDTLRLDAVDDVLRRRWSLRGVQTGGTHDVLIAALGQLRVSGAWRNHQDAFVFIDIGRRLCGGGAEMANHILNTIVNNFVGDGDGLFRVAGIVIFHADQFVAFNTAFGVDVFNGLARAVELHIAPLGNRAGQRTNNGNFNIVRRSGM